LQTAVRGRLREHYGPETTNVVSISTVIPARVYTAVTWSASPGSRISMSDFFSSHPTGREPTFDIIIVRFYAGLLIIIFRYTVAAVDPNYVYAYTVVVDYFTCRFLYMYLYYVLRIHVLSIMYVYYML